MDFGLNYFFKMSKLKHQKSKITVIDDSDSLDSSDVRRNKGRHQSILLPNINITSPRYKVNISSPTMVNVLNPHLVADISKPVRAVKTTMIGDG